VISVRRLIASFAVALPSVVAASAHAYVYWGEPRAGAIGRANNDGTGIENGFIETGGAPIAVAVNSSHIYWVRSQLPPHTRYVRKHPRGPATSHRRTAVVLTGDRRSAVVPTGAMGG
jgi:hypothetical protein